MRKKVNFKWNPFSLSGEAPVSLRWAPEGDEFEFATKEDLEKIKANPELAKVHQAMLVGVNKKMQASAEEKKQLLKQVEGLTSQMKEIDGKLLEWEDWSVENRPLLEKFVSSQERESDPDLRVLQGREKGKEKGGEMDKQYQKLVASFEQGAKELKGEIARLNKVVNYTLQIGDLRRERPDVDVSKVLDTALKEGLDDLSRAYKIAYHDEIVGKEVEMKLKPRLEEELAKRNTNVETGSGSVPISFELPKEQPKSFTDAGIQFLQERAKEGVQSQSESTRQTGKE